MFSILPCEPAGHRPLRWDNGNSPVLRDEQGNHDTSSRNCPAAATGRCKMASQHGTICGPAITGGTKCLFYMQLLMKTLRNSVHLFPISSSRQLACRAGSDPLCQVCTLCGHANSPQRRRLILGITGCGVASIHFADRRLPCFRSAHDFTDPHPQFLSSCWHFLVP